MPKELSMDKIEKEESSDNEEKSFLSLAAKSQSIEKLDLMYRDQFPKEANEYFEKFDDKIYSLVSYYIPTFYNGEFDHERHKQNYFGNFLLGFSILVSLFSSFENSFLTALFLQITGQDFLAVWDLLLLLEIVA